MKTELSDAEKIRKLPWLIGAETLNITFVLLTFSGSVFILFLNELGLDNNQIGFLLSLVPFCGIIAPFIAPAVTKYGYKRIFVSFWGIRDLIIVFLLFTPSIVSRFGSNGAFTWVAIIILLFAISRAIAETGGYLWKKEVVPDSIRGKFGAINSMSTTIAGILVVTGAGYIIDSQTGLGRFMTLITIGVGMGLLSVVAFSQVPAESSNRVQLSATKHLQGIKQAVRNENFILFLLVLGLASIGGRSVISFIPLYMKEQVGLSDGVVVLLGIGTYIGALLTSYFWGWAADRYGSKPVMQTSLYLMLMLPVLWFLLPHHNAISAPLAMAVSVIMGIATLAWQISWTRYLFVNAIPDDNRSAYMATYYAWFGIVNGIGPILAGQLLSNTENLFWQRGLLTIDAYSPLFGLSFLLLLISAITLSRLKTSDRTTFRRFAGMFLRGNPVKAMRLLVQYNFSGDEMNRVTTTEQMGDAHSLISSQELIEALDDPSFEVRYEAIRAIGRLPATSELVNSLIRVLEDNESELSIVATRSLGRLGHHKAIRPLRRSLISGYPPLEASSARALAQLNDKESITLLLQKLQDEPNSRLQVAYASALGQLQARDATKALFAQLRQAQSDVSRWEIGLALARIAGGERYYLQHWRDFHNDTDTAVIQALHTLQKAAKQCDLGVIETVAEGCTQNFAHGNPAAGIACLKTMMAWFPKEHLDEDMVQMLAACSQCLAQFGNSRKEIILLSLHVLDAAFERTILLVGAT